MEPIYSISDDGQLHSVTDIGEVNFDNAEDITTDEMKAEIAALGVGTKDNISNIKRKV